ncbi:hypothetical protein RN001_011720 [Aquatica leii]|uniref:Myb-like, SWIRM and MPN domain-containing protein 1 n=1 Tax=Aquatica leii TaxID=1421715 RepID=A0AAN7QE29_9COLE|nr:hypothetical protein RN001_011720 [Aquatica leii]
MADDDEIDILGDFSLDSLLSKNDTEIYNNSGLESHNSEILSCNCSPQWYLDQHSSTCWYNNHSDICTDFGQEPTHKPENQISTENNINDDSGWTKKEKSLLERGIEIFGRSNARLAQFIGTKSTAEVKHFLKHYFVNNGTSLQLECDDQTVIEETIVTSDSVLEISAENEILHDSQIPASIEEVIAVVSTAIPTIPVNSKKLRKNSGTSNVDTQINFNNIASGQSVLKNSVYKHFKSANKNSKLPATFKRRITSEAKFKFKTKMKVAKVKKRTSILEQENTIKTNVFETRPTITNINGEEIIKISKEDTDDELDLDVENDDSQKENITISTETNTDANHENVTDYKQQNDNKIEKPIVDRMEEAEKLTKSTSCLPIMKDEVSKQLMSMEIPTSEVILAKDVITELEKYFHSEFFEKRPTKTPNRYLKIRNHILNTWFMLKPSYVTKTSIRPGLKNCGDVNCIGRIHNFLEQIGAINFGCAQTNYIRPLHDMLLANVPIPKDKVIKEVDLGIPKAIGHSRPRIKKKFLHDGEGGCTLTHNENGDVINTTVVNEEPVVKQRPYLKNPSIRLIYCKAFTEEQPQKFDIKLHLHTLLLMDLHAHTSLSEVMGLIGGYWNAENKTLTILRYVPCRNIASSATHCDMCPISQARAADIIHSEGFNILGWFHSHPTFAPEPSQQDLDTQLTVQQWIGNNKPCIGLILSPFSAHGALIASPYRCLMVVKKTNFEDQFVPFKFKVDLISPDFDINDLLNLAWTTFNKDCNVNVGDRIDFTKPYFLDQSITYFDKFISSLKMHLAKCADINKKSCDKIIEGFTNICFNSL